MKATAKAPEASGISPCLTGDTSSFRVYFPFHMSVDPENGTFKVPTSQRRMPVTQPIKTALHPKGLVETRGFLHCVW